MRSNPLKIMPKSIPESACFGALRKHDTHTGIDLHCNDGDEVFAIESGEVIAIKPFTGTKAESPWWEETDYIGILGPSGYIIYGEVKSKVLVGQKVIAGEPIANVKRVLKNNKQKPMSMLHLELYTKVCEPIIWPLNSLPPAEILNPMVLINLENK